MKEERICQNCKQNFTIESEDFDFYKKIEVPPPTFCPECRMKRRAAFMPARTLFRRMDYAGKDILSIFPPNASFPIFDEKMWWSDVWDPLDYGMKYDSSKSFLSQFKTLMDSVPRANVINLNSVDCKYCPSVTFSKGSYFTVGFETFNCMYGYYTRTAHECVDYYFLIDCERCYESTYLRSCSGVSFSEHSSECRDSFFLSDCRDCSNCFGCVGLRNKKYYVWNKSCSKEEYEKIIADFLGSFSGISKAKNLFTKFSMSIPKRYARIYHSKQVTGDNIRNSNDCLWCFDIDPLSSVSEHSRRIVSATATRECHDLFDTGEGAELCYEGSSCAGFGIKFSSLVISARNVEYSYNCHNCEDLFGCVGLRKKQYCILNHQYEKTEYEKLRAQIIGEMKEYGEFWPVQFSPLAYNDTIAYERFSLTKEEALSQGFIWRDLDVKDYISTIQEIPDHINDVPDSITDEIIQCSHRGSCNHQCTTAFKVIPEELKFYRRMNLPLPRLCPNCRHYERLARRNPLKLWSRQCQCAGEKSENGIYTNTAKHQHEGKCSNEFETSYAPERKEIVYCEKCYQAEVV